MYISIILVWFVGNFTDDDIGEPILDATLCAGDLLYFPRGTIHQVEKQDNDPVLLVPIDDWLSLYFAAFKENTGGESDFIERWYT